MFQNKYVKAIKNNFIHNSNYTRGKFIYKNTFYKNIKHGTIGVWFHKKSIEISFQFNDVIPNKHYESIFNLAKKNQLKIHDKIQFEDLTYDYIQYNFPKKNIKDISYNDIITALNNLTDFCNTNIVHLLEKLTIDE